MKYLLFFLFSFSIVIKINAQKIVPCSCKEETTNKTKYGFCDSLRTKYVIKCQYDSAYPVINGLARIIKDGKIGYIDITGKLVIAAQYEEGENFSDGFAYVKKDGNYFYINKSGLNQFKKFFPLPSLQKTDGLSEGVKKIAAEQLATIRKESSFQEGFAKFYDTAIKKIGFIDTKGNAIVPAQYIYATKFSEGIAFVKEIPTLPFKAINKKGIRLFELENETRPLPEGYINGFAIVMIKPAAGSYAIYYNYIDKTGKMLLQKPVKNAQPFSNNYAIITDSEDFMLLINNIGVKAFDQPLKYLGNSAIKGIYFYSNEPARGFGLIDITGKRRTKPGYDNFTKVNDNIFLCKPWGSVVYNLLSIDSGELLYASRFTSYFWMPDANKLRLRLTGTDFLSQQPMSLDFEPATGKYFKEGKEIPIKDNHHLAVNYIKTEKDKTELEGKLNPGIIKYENKHFSLRFPKEMKIFKDTVNRTVYTQSTYFFSIEKFNFTGDYLAAVMKRFQDLGKYDNFNYELLAMPEGNLRILLCKSKKKAGEKQAQFFFVVLDNEKIKTEPNEIYLLSGNYFVMDEGFYGTDFRATLYSLKIK